MAYCKRWELFDINYGGKVEIICKYGKFIKLQSVYEFLNLYWEIGGVIFEIS